MAIFKKHKVENYTTIDNSLFKNANISYKATGLLSTMLSLPEDWSFSEEGLAKLKKDSRKSISSGLKELEENGYLIRGRARTEDGRLGEATYDIYEIPYEPDSPMFPFPTLDNPTLENAHNKILNNKVLNNKEKEIYKERFKKPSLEEVKTYCSERKNSIDAESFINFYESKGWKIGKTPMKDWKAAIRTWERNSNQRKSCNRIEPTWFNQDLKKESLNDEELKEIEKEFEIFK